MTGTQVRELRVALRLDPAHFAQLLGVHPSTLYRWEAAGDVPVRVEPFQQQILAVLQRQVAAPRGGNEDLGETILKGLLVGGAMFGLFKLLEAAFSDGRGLLGGRAPAAPAGCAVTDEAFSGTMGATVKRCDDAGERQLRLPGVS